MAEMIRLGAWFRTAMVDLRGGTARFLILIACLSLGVSTIAAVSSVSAVLRTAVARDARLILGGDLELRSPRSDIGAEERRALERLGPLSREVELNARAVKDDRSVFLSLRAVSDSYPLLGAVGLGPGSWDRRLPELLAARQGIFGAVVDSQVVQRLGISIGDRVRIGSADFEVRGTLASLPDQASQGFQLGVPVIIADSALSTAGLDQNGVLTRYRYKLVLETVDFATAKQRLAEEFPDADWQLRSPGDATAGISRFFRLFGNFLVLVGLSALLVGGLGVSNAVSAYVGERQASIATLRSLGATSHRLLFHFLTQIIALSLVGIGAGVTLGAATTLLALPALSGLLGLALPPSVDLPSLLGAAGIGLATAFLFALVPLRSAQNVRPAMLFRAATAGPPAHFGWRELLRVRTWVPLAAGMGGLFVLAAAMTGDPLLVLLYGAGTAAALGVLRLAAAGLQHLLRKLPPPPAQLLRQAVNAILRPGAPTPTIVESLGMGLALLFVILLTQPNLRGQINDEIVRQAPSFVLLDVDADTKNELAEFAAGNPHVADFDTVPMLRGTITAINGKPAPEPDEVPADVADMFRGDTPLSWARDEPPAARITEGRWWPTDYSGPPLASLSTEMQQALGLGVGDIMEITVLGRPISVTIASFREIDWRSPSFNFRILLSPGLIEGAPQTFLGGIKVTDGADAVVETELVRRFPSLLFIPVGQAIGRVSAILESLAKAVGLVGGLAAVAGVLVLAGALSVGRRQRESDAVVMKVLGATRRDVVGAFLMEYGLLGAFSTLFASALGIAGSWAVAAFLLEVPFTVDVALMASAAGGVILLSVLTGAATTWSAMSARPAQRLRAEAF